MIKVEKRRTNYKNRVGEKHTTVQGYGLEIIEYFCATNCTIQFSDGVILYNVAYSQIKRRTLRNPNYPSVYGIGYIGVGDNIPTFGGKGTRAYFVWSGILERGHNEKFQERLPAYKDCFVVNEWLNFQVFAEWFKSNWNIHMQGWHLDKDILIKGNKIYSPETCCFVPREINNLFIKNSSSKVNLPIGVFKKYNKFTSQISINGNIKHLGMFNTPEEAFQAYKEAKEQQIKEKADEWKGRIDTFVYQAMYNWRVEIID